MKKHILFLIIYSLFLSAIQAQNQSDLIELSKLFSETDLTIPNDTVAIAYSDEGILYTSEVLHLPKRAQNNNLNKILVLVDSTLYSSCEYHIKRYAYDIYLVYGCEIKMIVINKETCSDVKNLILSDSTSLDGAVFIGDVAPAIYKGNDVFHKAAYKWFCDMYYMDLDAIWSDQDNDGVFDSYNGIFYPEIFIGRIRANNVGNSSDEQKLFEKYLDKNHTFWIGHRPINKKYALSYTNASWSALKNDLINGIHFLYGQNNCDTITSNNTLFCANDYLERLQNERYEFIQLASHSNSHKHLFDSLVPNPAQNTYDTLHVNIYNSTIYANGVNALGMNLYCCTACKWDYNGYIGGAYVYGPNSSVLSLIGSTKTGSMLDVYNFYTPLSFGKTMGQAFVDWWRNGSSSYNMNNIQKISWYFGLTIVGDPLVNFFHCTNSTCQDQVTLTSYNTTNSPLSYHLASESITIAPSSGSFTIPVGDHCILSAPTVEINGAFFCPLGSSMEINNEGCGQNCDD